MRTWTWLSCTVAVPLLGMFASRAAAQDCTADSDCAKSYTCEVVATSGCGYACPEGADPCEPPPDFMCDTMEYKACQPGPCTSDADCEDGMVCWEQDSYDCPPATQADCPPGSDCPTPKPVDCTPTKLSTCVPKYVPPCTEDADCGDGFKCVEQQSVSCSGGSATPAMGGGSSPSDPAAAGAPAPEPTPPVEPQCTSTPSGAFYCEAQQVACETDSDCATGWSCGDNPSRPVCSGTSTEPAPAPGAPQDAGVDAVPPPAPAPEPLPPDCGVDTSVPARVCIPPFSDIGYYGGSLAQASGAAEGGVARDATGAPVPAPTAPDGADMQAASDTNTTTGSSESGSQPKASSGGLCSVGAPGAGSAGAGSMLGLLGLSLLAVRRRRAA